MHLAHELTAIPRLSSLFIAMLLSDSSLASSARTKSHFRLPAIPSETSTLEKRGCHFFPDAEAAADAVAVSFLYSTLA